jgi:hypothetical protein
LRKKVTDIWSAPPEAGAEIVSRAVGPPRLPLCSTQAGCGRSRVALRRLAAPFQIEPCRIGKQLPLRMPSQVKPADTGRQIVP